MLQTYAKHIFFQQIQNDTKKWLFCNFVNRNNSVWYKWLAFYILVEGSVWQSGSGGTAALDWSLEALYLVIRRDRTKWFVSNWRWGGKYLSYKQIGVFCSRTRLHYLCRIIYAATRHCITQAIDSVNSLYRMLENIIYILLLRINVSNRYGNVMIVIWGSNVQKEILLVPMYRSRASHIISLWWLQISASYPFMTKQRARDFYFPWFWMNIFQTISSTEILIHSCTFLFAKIECSRGLSNPAGDVR